MKLGLGEAADEPFGEGHAATLEETWRVLRSRGIHVASEGRMHDRH